jgi:general secretion pathway protein H
MRNSSNGYTLLEVLIVILIISIVATVASMTIHFNKNKQMETLAHEIANLITLAEEEAIARPAVLGLAFTSHQFQFFIYQENNHAWQPLTNKVFRARTIPNDVQMTLTIHNTIIPNEGKPALIISTSGDIPAFTISIGKTEQKPLYQVVGEANGKVYAK